MKRVFYAYCTKPDAPERVKAFEEELDWHPVMIITCAAREPRMRELYPSVPIYDRRQFNESFSPLAPHELNASNLLDDMEFISPYLSQILFMMNRFAMHADFALRERMRYVRRLAHEWGSLLDDLKPDVVHFDETPHGVVYFVIYLLCKRRGIPTVWFAPTGFPGRNLLSETIGATPLGHLYANDCPAVSPLPETVPEDVMQRVRSLRNEGEFSHWYMHKQDDFARGEEARRAVPLALKVAGKAGKIVNIHKWHLYAAHAWNTAASQVEDVLSLDAPTDNEMFYLPPTAKRSITNREVLRQLRLREEFKRKLESEYSALAQQLETDGVAYVYFPMHFQPERTTNPEGGLLRDQLLAIAAVHDAMPPDWLLYVREHPTEFNPNPVFASSKVRDAVDYRDLLELPRVRLASMGMLSSELVRGSRATVTITGTASWEGAINGIPGIHLAHTWYEGYPGTHFAGDFATLRDLLHSLESMPRVSEERESEYLRTFVASTFPFEINEQEYPPDAFSREAQREGAVAAMRWWESRLSAGDNC